MKGVCNCVCGCILAKREAHICSLSVQYLHFFLIDNIFKGYFTNYTKYFHWPSRTNHASGDVCTHLGQLLRYLVQAGSLHLHFDLVLAGLMRKQSWLYFAGYKIANALSHAFILSSLSDLLLMGTQIWCGKNNICTWCKPCYLHQQHTTIVSRVR